MRPRARSADALLLRAQRCSGSRRSSASWSSRASAQRPSSPRRTPRQSWTCAISGSSSIARSKSASAPSTSPRWKRALPRSPKAGAERGSSSRARSAACEPLPETLELVQGPGAVQKRVEACGIQLDGFIERDEGFLAAPELDQGDASVVAGRDVGGIDRLERVVARDGLLESPQGTERIAPALQGEGVLRVEGDDARADLDLLPVAPLGVQGPEQLGQEGHEIGMGFEPLPRRPLLPRGVIGVAAPGEQGPVVGIPPRAHLADQLLEERLGAFGVAEALPEARDLDPSAEGVVPRAAEGARVLERSRVVADLAPRRGAGHEREVAVEASLLRTRQRLIEAREARFMLPREHEEAALEEGVEGTLDRKGLGTPALLLRRAALPAAEEHVGPREVDAAWRQAAGAGGLDVLEALSRPASHGQRAAEPGLGAPRVDGDRPIEELQRIGHAEFAVELGAPLAAPGQRLLGAGQEHAVLERAPLCLRAGGPQVQGHSRRPQHEHRQHEARHHLVPPDAPPAAAHRADASRPDRLVLGEGPQIRRHLEGRGVAPPRLLLQRPDDDGLEIAGNVRMPPPRRGRVAAEDRGDHLPVVLGLVRRPQGQQLVERRSERVDVAAMIDPLAPSLLGAHVERRAETIAGGGHRALAPGDPSQPEVDDLQRPVGIEDQVRGLDVAVDHPLGVRGLESLGDPGEGPGHAAVPGHRSRVRPEAAGAGAPFLGSYARLRHQLRFALFPRHRALRPAPEPPHALRAPARARARPPAPSSRTRDPPRSPRS